MSDFVFLPSFDGASHDKKVRGLSIYHHMYLWQTDFGITVLYLSALYAFDGINYITKFVHCHICSPLNLILPDHFGLILPGSLVSGHPAWVLSALQWSPTGCGRGDNYEDAPVFLTAARMLSAPISPVVVVRLHYSRLLGGDQSKTRPTHTRPARVTHKQDHCKYRNVQVKQV